MTEMNKSPRFAFPENRALLGSEGRNACTDETMRAAALTVAHHSKDAAECAELLAMLGLTPVRTEEAA